MSLQNQKTVAAYQKKAGQYIANTNKIDTTSLEKANDELHRFIKKGLRHIPDGGKILEVGAADGRLSAYIKKLGYDITASDVADGFIDEMAKKGLRPIRFNLLEDELLDKYHCIICWKVFVHFTQKDAADAMAKIYSALSENGILVLNFISDETKSVKEEWVDFPNEYSMGVDRYFRYYSRKEVEDIIAKTGFCILDFQRKIGVEGQPWLVYVFRKSS